MNRYGRHVHRRPARSEGAVSHDLFTMAEPEATHDKWETYMATQTLFEVSARSPINAKFGFLAVFVLPLFGCQGIHDAQSLLVPSLQRSELFGLVAGFGTTFAAMPDLIAMLRRRSSVGMNPRMAAIMGVFQILWVYYGLLIASRPVVVWNLIAIVVNVLSVSAYFYFVAKEKAVNRRGLNTG
jgi:uncharacterized protein with PQ loop repeat